jgi:hypothetical protein
MIIVHFTVVAMLAKLLMRVKLVMIAVFGYFRRVRLTGLFQCFMFQYFLKKLR